MIFTEINFDTKVAGSRQYTVICVKGSNVSWRQEVYQQDETTVDRLIIGAHYCCKSKPLDGSPVDFFRIVSFENGRLIIEDLPKESESESI